MKTEELDFEDILRMGGDKAYELLQDIHDADMKHGVAVRRLFVEKQHLLRDATNYIANQ